MRTLKFVKYLPEFGWRPIILTVDNRYYPSSFQDLSLLDEIPAIASIYRTGTAISPPFGETSSKSSSLAEKKNHLGKYFRSLLEKIVPRKMGVIQDYGFFWLPQALLMARKIIRTESIDLIFTTSPPHSVHLLGKTLRKRYHLPWVADFRDGWTRTEMYVAESPLRRRFDKACERAIIREADQVVCVTPPIVDDFCQDYPKAKAKTHVIYNGFDPADFESSAEPIRNREVFTLTYVGSLSARPHRSPDVVLQAARSLAEKNADFQRRCKIEFVGLTVELPLQEMIKECGLESMCSVVGLVSHTAAIEYMKKADVLLLLINFRQRFGDSGILTGKFAEYLATGKPILAVTTEGIAANLIREHHLGTVVAPDDVKGIDKALSDYFHRWQNNLLLQSESLELTQMLNRKCSTQKLANVFVTALQEMRQRDTDKVGDQRPEDQHGTQA